VQGAVADVNGEHSLGEHSQENQGRVVYRVFKNAPQYSCNNARAVKAPKRNPKKPDAFSQKEMRRIKKGDRRVRRSAAVMNIGATVFLGLIPTYSVVLRPSGFRRS
jgi:hypothetical protein